MTYKCLVCNKVYNREFRSNRIPKYCGMTCLGLSRKGSLNINWKGEKVDVNSLHTWLKNNMNKPKACSKCDSNTKLDLANVSHGYNPETYTRDFKNWRWLCRACHMTEDGRTKRLISRNKQKIRQ